MQMSALHPDQKGLSGQWAGDSDSGEQPGQGCGRRWGWGRRPPGGSSRRARDWRIQSARAVLSLWQPPAVCGHWTLKCAWAKVRCADCIKYTLDSEGIV